MKRILFVMRARFGDMLMATPALRAIKQRYPQAELTVVADNKRGTILQGLSYIDRLVLLPKVFWPLMSWFGIRYFDYGVVCIAAHDKSAQKLGRRWAKVVAAEDQGYIQADHIIPPRADGEHLVKDAFRFARPLQAEPAGWKIEYVPSQEETLNAQNWLSEAFGRSDGELIGLQLASFPTKSYRDWPQEHYLQLIEALLAQDAGRRIVLLGSDESLSRAEWLLEICPKQVVSAVKRFNFRDNAALIGQLDLYMGPYRTNACCRCPRAAYGGGVPPASSGSYFETLGAPCPDDADAAYEHRRRSTHGGCFRAECSCCL